MLRRYSSPDGTVRLTAFDRAGRTVAHVILSDAAYEGALSLALLDWLEARAVSSPPGTDEANDAPPPLALVR